MSRGLPNLAALLLLLGLAGAASAQPYRPTRDDQILEHLPPGLTAGRAQLRALQAARSGASNDLDQALALADSYIRIGRGEADPRLYSYAEGVLRPWTDRADPPSPVVLRRASIRQFRHDFDGALDDLNLLIARGYDDPRAWLLKASILRVRGRYAAAIDSCARLTAYPDQLIALTCACEIQSLGGDSRAAKANLSRALAAEPAAAPLGEARASDVLAWSQLVLAGIAEREGDLATAERWYRAALAKQPDDAFALSAYADFLLDQHRPAEAERLLDARQANDGLLLRLALARAQRAPSAAQPLVPVLHARFDAVRARGDQPHLGDEARLGLVLERRPDAAFRLALENWRLLREPRDALILAQSALATGERRDARTALNQLSGQDINDRRLATLRRRLAKAAVGDRSQSPGD